MNKKEEEKEKTTHLDFFVFLCGRRRDLKWAIMSIDRYKKKKKREKYTTPNVVKYIIKCERDLNDWPKKEKED